MKKILLVCALLQTILLQKAAAQTDVTATKDTLVAVPTPKKEESKKKWFETFSLRGYAQIRYNRLLETNPNLKCDQCDRSIGDNGGIFFRRARITLSGFVHPRFFLYVQTDVTTNATISSTSSGLNYLQLRDFYGDLFIDPKKTVKLRIGLSKVPFGFDVLQSSQNRLAFDRSDAINSGAYNERDMGVYLYYTPTKIQERFKMLQNAKLKGSGDYGIFGIGVYNGQTANRLSANNDLHAIARVSYPFALKSQIIEVGAQAYSGYYNVAEVMSAGVTTPRGNKSVLDQRVATSLIIYPKPIGFQAEYNWGEGPQFTQDAPGVYSIRKRHLEGGYAQLSGAFNVAKTYVMPYVRYQYYHGGKKAEIDTRYYDVHETEIGFEWHPVSFLETTIAYMISDRVFEDSKMPDNHQRGNLLRLQLQFNY